MSKFSRVSIIETLRSHGVLHRLRDHRFHDASVRDDWPSGIQRVLLESHRRLRIRRALSQDGGSTANEPLPASFLVAVL